MTIAAILDQVRTVLHEWAGQYGGKAVVTAGAAHAAELATAKPLAPVAMVFLDQEPNPGDLVLAGSVQTQFAVVLSFPRSFALHRGEALVEAGPSQPGAYDLLEECRDQVRRIDFDATTGDSFCLYAGLKNFEWAGLLFEAWRLDFQIRRNLPLYQE
jgi:hypothetical protein